MEQDGGTRRPTRRRERGAPAEMPERQARYRRLRNPFVPQRAFSDDRIEAMHEAALRVLEDLGIRVLLDEARALLRGAGALVDEDSGMVRIGREIVAAALAAAPRSIRLRAANPEREQVYEPGALLFGPGAGCPNITDRVRGRRPGTLADYEDTLRLNQSFDAIHLLSPSAEPQDVPVPLRHYAMTRAQIALSDKPAFAYARGRAQVEDCFAMLRLAHGLDEAGFRDGVWLYTVINTNSPRQIDRPMAQGIIDFARAGQLSVITPFCLAGAMAPVTMAGALVLQHAEALAGIALAEVAAPGAPVSYGGFASNVDMRSGAPAFGTPEQVTASLGSGQLARLIGLPWRSAAGSAANMADAQGASENAMALWGAVLAGATSVLHGAGWLEGGLTFGMEKFITDMDMVQTIAELCTAAPATDDDLALDALAEVAPGGHFFGAAHTMSRYREAFYTPLAADLSNFGTWREAGALPAEARATAIWQERLAAFRAPDGAADRAERLDAFIDARTAAGGAPPLD